MFAIHATDGLGAYSKISTEDQSFTSGEVSPTNPYLGQASIGVAELLPSVEDIPQEVRHQLFNTISERDRVRLGT